jgi:hypothetical protein
MERALLPWTGEGACLVRVCERARGGPQDCTACCCIDGIHLLNGVSTTDPPHPFLSPSPLLLLLLLLLLHRHLKSRDDVISAVEVLECGVALALGTQGHREKDFCERAV